MASRQKSSDMKVPNRPAPPLPTDQRRFHLSLSSGSLCSDRNKLNERVYKSSSLSDFGTSHDKKKPPPRPPPPRLKTGQGSSLLGVLRMRKEALSKNKAPATAIVKPMPSPSVPSLVPTGSLIDLNSPSSSPTFTTKSSSDAVSINSFGSDVISFQTSSQVESGFEDDFDPIMSSNVTSPTTDSWSDHGDPFSPIPEKTADIFGSKPDRKKISPLPIPALSKPTIIKVSKPKRPPPPGAQLSSINPSLNVNRNHTAVKPFIHSSEIEYSRLEKEGSPPMPNVPPPPPPPEALDVLLSGPKVPPRPTKQFVPEDVPSGPDPYCIAQYDYSSDHPDDLSFTVGDKIVLVEKVSSEWLKGRLSGAEGIFPESYVKIVIPLQERNSHLNMTVIAIYSFSPETWDDLELKEGDIVKVIARVDDGWLYGECEGRKGQFPVSFVQDITDLEEDS